MSLRRLKDSAEDLLQFLVLLVIRECCSNKNNNCHNTPVQCSIRPLRFVVIDVAVKVNDGCHHFSLPHYQTHVPKLQCIWQSLFYLGYGTRNDDDNVDGGAWISHPDRTGGSSTASSLSVAVDDSVLSVPT